MHPSTRLNDAFKQAVTPGPDRSLAGVALGAAARPRKDAASALPDVLAAFGTSQLDSASKPVTSDTVMWIASCSKLVTTVAALQCIERGLFSLDDPNDVDRLLPEWKDPQLIVGWNEDETPKCESTKERVTVRMLLTHTSGFAYDFMSPDLMRWRKGRGEGSIAMRVPMVESFTTPISFEPGTSWSYGCGLDLLGLMVARANDEKLETYFQRNIFQVLGMNSTSFHPTEHASMMDRLMPLTSRLATGELIDGDAPDAVMRQPLRPADEFGGGGLFSTAADYLKLLKSILLDDGKILKAESIDALFTPCLSPPQKKGLDIMLSIPQTAAIMIPGEPLVGTPGASDYSHSLGGLVNFEGSDFGLQPGWLAWGGAPNLHWYIDRKGGTCGIFATQLFPPGELKHAQLWKIFQEETIKHFT